MRLVFSINTWLSFYPPIGVMSILWFLVGFVVTSVSFFSVLCNPVHAFIYGVFSRTPPTMDLMRAESRLS